MIFYISDTHFGRDHPLLLRGYATINEMTEALIENWNRKVKEDDIVYFVGDISDNSQNDVSSYLERLNGRKHLILGNQDRTIIEGENFEKLKPYFESIGYYKEIMDEERIVVLCHYPMMDWYKRKRGSYMVYGHLHQSTNVPFWDYILHNDYMLNAGVDVNNLEPVTLDELIVRNKIFKEKNSVQ